MNYSKITLTFNADLAINERIGFEASLNSVSIYETWAAQRTQSYLVTQGTATAIVGERSAINFVQAFNLDFNSTNLYEVTRTDNVVVIESTVADNDFSGFYNYADITTGEPYALSGSVSASIENFSGDVLTIDTVSVIEATVNAVCTHYRADRDWET